MKERIILPSEIKEVQGEIPLNYLYTVGIAGEKFFNGLLNKKLIASKCPKCKKTYLPAKIYCEDCFVELNDFVEIKNEGEIYSFTIVNFGKDGEKLKKSETIAFVKFKGVEGGLIQRIKKENVKIGMKVKVNFDKVSKDNLMAIEFE